MLDPAWIAFAATILSGLPTELAGALSGHLITDRFDKLKRQLALALPDANHDLQKALTDSFWLAILYVVAEREPSEALGLPFSLGGAWSALQSLSPARLRQRGREEAEREKIALLVGSLYPKLVRKLNDAAPPDQTVAIGDVYAEVEKLLVRAPSRTQAQAMLADEAVRHLVDIAIPLDVPDAILDSLRAQFDSLFRRAFAEAVKRNTEVERILNATLLSEVHGAAHRTETKVDRLLELVAPAHSLALPPPEPGPCYGREVELAELRTLLIVESSAAAAPVLVCSGLPGVGKSLLVETFAYRHWREHFPGGYVSLKLDPRNPQDAGACLLQLGRGLRLPESANVRERLVEPRTLVHLENVDSDALAAACETLTREHLQGVPVVMSSRLQARRAWRTVEIEEVSEAAALEILAEYNVAGDEKARELVKRLGRLPLAIRLVGGALEAGSHTVAGLLAKGEFLDITDKSRPEERQQQLRACFRISLEVLLASEPGAVEPLRAFGYVPLAGVGTSLGRAYCGLEEDDFRRVLARASRLSLTIHERGALEEEGGRWRAHPLLADFLRRLESGDDEGRFGRVRAWFEARFPETGDERQGRAWREIGGETAALEAWLAEAPEELIPAVNSKAMRLAIRQGPFRLWMGFCQRGLEWPGLGDQAKSDLLWTLSNVAQSAGDLDLAIEVARQNADHDGARGADRDKALALSKIADLLQARGDLDGALRIRREEQLPVYAKLGDVRSKAVTMGKIADVLQARGDLDGALRIRREEELPVYEKLGDVRAKAVTMAKIAGIEWARGNVDEAILGYECGVIPSLEMLGAERDLAQARWNLAGMLRQRGRPEDLARVKALTEQAYEAARRMGLPLAEEIAASRGGAANVGE